MGIEPTCSAWKADILPLNYTRRYSVLMPYYYNTRLQICQAFSEIFFKFTITDIFLIQYTAFADTMHKKERPEFLPRAFCEPCVPLRFCLSLRRLCLGRLLFIFAVFYLLLILLLSEVFLFSLSGQVRNSRCASQNQTCRHERNAYTC